MLVTVSSILQAQSPITRYDFNESIPLPDEGEQLLEPLKGVFVIERVSDRLLKLTGDFQTRAELLCDRCSEPFPLAVSFTLDEALDVVHEPVTTVEVDDRVAHTGSLDVTDLFRQHLLLSLPSRRLCGCVPKNNTVETAPTDPRWSALQSFDSNGKH